MKTRAAATFGLLACLGLWPVLRGDAAFFYRDVTRQYAPLQAQLDRAWSEGVVPTWNPSTQGGVPLLANVHAGVLAPWWPLFRALEFSKAYGWAVALAWAAWTSGLFVLLRRRRLGAGAALLGALTGGFGGVALSSTTYLPLLGALACVPWQLAVLEQPSGPRRTVQLAALFALQVLLGDPSMAVVGGLACLVASGGRRTFRGLAGAAVLAIGFCAVVLLPAWTLYEESSRASSSLEARLAWSFHPARVLEWVVRRPFGGLLEAPFFERWDLAAGPDAQPFFLEHGWGVWGLLFVPLALVRRGALRVQGVVLIALGLVLSLGTHLGAARELFALPPLSFFRFPERYAVLTLLGAALLVAHGAEWISQRATHRVRAGAAWLGLAGLLGAASFAAGAVTADAMRMTAAGVAVAGVLALVVGRVRWAWLTVVVVLGVVEGALAARAAVLTLPTEVASARMLPKPGHRLWRENAPLRALETPARGVDAFRTERRALHATFASATPGLHGVDELGGYSPVVLKRWQRVIQALASKPTRLSQLFDVCWFVSTEARGAANPEWVRVETLAPSTWLYESPHCGGRAWTVDEVATVEDVEDAVEWLTSPAFDPRRRATVEAVSELPSEPLGTTTVTVAPRLASNELSLTLGSIERWTLVVASEAWAPGWRVFVDGEEREVARLDGTLLGVFAPPGASSVRFVYEEPLLVTGAALSVVSLLLALLLWRQRANA